MERKIAIYINKEIKMETYYFIGFRDKSGKFYYIENGHDGSYTVTPDFKKADLHRVYFPDNHYPIKDYYFQQVKLVFPDAKVYQVRFQPVLHTIPAGDDREVYLSEADPIMRFDYNLEKYYQSRIKWSDMEKDEELCPIPAGEDVVVPEKIGDS